MDNEKLAPALQLATSTRYLQIGPAALGAVPSIFGEGFGQLAAVVVADATTFGAAGQLVDQLLRTAGLTVAEPIIFAAQPLLYADFETVVSLQEVLKTVEAVPVAVGSGTLNDLTKLAAHRLGRPYMVVATAASMDGYTAFGAAITKEGFKQTISCPAPSRGGPYW